MLKEELLRIRNMIPEGVPYMIEGNGNIEAYVGNRDCEFTFFDDNNNVICNVRPNNEQDGVRYKYPVMVQLVPYDQIQKISILHDLKSLREYLENTRLVSEEEIKKVITLVAPLCRANINPFEKTNRTLTTDEYLEVINKK